MIDMIDDMLVKKKCRQNFVFVILIFMVAGTCRQVPNAVINLDGCIVFPLVSMFSSKRLKIFSCTKLTLKLFTQTQRPAGSEANYPQFYIR